MTDLVKTNLNRTLQATSLKDLVRMRNPGEVALLLDCSGSMQTLMINQKTRIAGLRETVDIISKQKTVKMIVFGALPEPRIVTNIPEPSGSTPLTQAIDFARNQQIGRMVLISDGQPDNPSTALEAAKRFGGQIDVVFVGDEGDYGATFLQELARVTGGEQFDGDLKDPKLLGKTVVGLLSGDTDDDDDDE